MRLYISFFIILSIYIIVIPSSFSQPIIWDKEAVSKILKDETFSKANDVILKTQKLYQNYQQLLIEQEIAQEAVRRGLCERLDVNNQLQNARRSILFNALKEDFLRQLPSPKIEEIKRYYEMNINSFTVPEAFKIEAFELDTSNKKLMNFVKVMNSNELLDKKLLLQSGAKKLTNDVDSWYTKKQIHQSIYKELLKMIDNEAKIVYIEKNAILVLRINYRKKNVKAFDNVYSEIEMNFKKKQFDSEWQKYILSIKKKLNF